MFDRQAWQRAYHLKNKSAIQAYQHEYGQAHSEMHWRAKLKHLYGIFPEEYERMFEAQKGCCAICGRHQSELRRHLAVDHDHVTGKIRGLLCVSCNVGLDGLQNNPELLRKAAAYLKR